RIPAAQVDTIHHPLIRRSGRRTGRIVLRGNKVLLHNLHIPPPREPPPTATTRINGKDRNQTNVRCRRRIQTSAPVSRGAQLLDKKDRLSPILTPLFLTDLFKQPLMRKPPNLPSSPIAA